MKKTILPIAFIVAVSANAQSIARKHAEYEFKIPSKEMMEKASKEYIRFCSACHGKEGQGRDAPPLKGSLTVTGPIGSTIHFVVAGEPHTTMPSWGLTQLSNESIAEILTYVRNAWGNNDKDKYGKNAGGIVTPELVKEYRDALHKAPVKKNIRI